MGSEVSLVEVSTVGQYLFQTNPRGVGGPEPMPLPSIVIWFQTNPRGVGGLHQCSRSPTLRRFRPTLVGSEVIGLLFCRLFFVVSDQPSWGRRYGHLRRADDSAGFRPTLVGSEVNTMDTPLSKRSSFRPTLVGSEARSLLREGGGRPMFQTNPRGVGGPRRRLPGASPCFRPTLVGSEGHW